MLLFSQEGVYLIMSELSEKNTKELFDEIRNAPEKFAERLNTEKLNTNRIMLSDYIRQKMTEKGITTKDLIIKTALSQSHIYQILGGTRTPGRDILINIALALSLTLEKTQRLLLIGRAGELYPRVRRDAALICCIEQRLGLIETSDFLQSISEHELI